MMNQLNLALNNETLVRKAPSIFANAAKSDVSEKYTFIPTIEVVDGMRANGWEPVWASEQRVRNAERRGFQKHMMRFRRSEDLTRSLNVRDVFPELVLINSHDRSSAYQLHAGLFRLVCSNGLVVADSTFEKISVKHVGFKTDDVIEASYKILKAVPNLVENVQTMRAIELTDAERLAFAESSLLLRFDSIEAAPIQAKALLSLRRSEDKAKDLWTTLNTVQENIVRGGLKDWSKRNENGQAFKRTTQIKSLDENVKVNKALWHLAEALKAHKAA
jgi:hypothetical protein